MGRYERKDDLVIDTYLRDASGDPSGNITTIISVCAEILGVSKSTVHRWRDKDCVTTAEDVMAIIVAVNKNRQDGKKCNLKDAAILCNYKKKFRRTIDQESNQLPE